MSVWETAADNIDRECKRDNNFKYNIECLDKYDFSEFLDEGGSLWKIRDIIEKKYTEEFRSKYGIYVFNCLDGEETADYFTSRYNIWFQSYEDWMVRREYGTYSETRKYDSSG